MNKLRLISTLLILLGIILFLCGIFLNMKEFLEYGLYAGIVGIIGYGVMFVFCSTTIEERKFLSD